MLYDCAFNLILDGLSVVRIILAGCDMRVLKYMIKHPAKMI